ncbi:MAG: hypothetical protein ABF293_08060 [Flavobacteriaceae bacterium]
MKKAFVLIVVVLLSCSSAQLVDTWKNPDIVIFDAYKVLIVGMTPNEDAREKFETKMKRQFTKRNIEAVRSIDLFDVEFTHAARTEKELDEVEQVLLDRDFDAILFTKVLGSESKQSFRQRMADLDSYYGKFSDDYLSNQDIYYDDTYYDQYMIYHAETSLYCICVGKERELIWRGAIDITDPIDLTKTIDDYIKLVVLAMGEQDVIFREEGIGESTSP